MKKLISLVLAVAMLLSLGSMSTFAASNIMFSGSGDLPTKGLTDDNADFDTKWDFEDFTWNSTDATSTYPDTISEPVWWVENGDVAKTTVGDTDRGSSLTFSSGNPNFYLLFGKLIKTGTLHATFYMKQDSGTGTGLLLGLTTGYYDNLAVKKDGEQGDVLQIKDGETATVKHATNPLTSGSWTAFSSNFASDKWHRIDYVVTDNATNANGLDIYLDGVKITSNGQIPLTQITYNSVSVSNPGIKGLRFGRWGGAIPTTYLDDVRVRRFSTNKGLTLEPETTEFTNNSLTINFTDMVDASKLTAENVKITRKHGAQAITDFTITPALLPAATGFATGVTITLGDTCYHGDYTINLDSSIKGIVTGGTATALTISKPAEAGVPVCNSGSYYGLDGKQLTAQPFTSFTKYVAAGFTNPVDLESAKEKVSLIDQNGNKVAGSYVSRLQGDNKTVIIELPEFLSAGKYRIKVENGLLSYDQTVSSTGVYLGWEVTVANDAGIKKESHVIEDGKHKYTFYKNDSNAYNLYVIAAKYQAGTNVLLDVSFKPVTIDTDEKGTFTNSFDVEFDAETDVKYFIWDQETFKPTFD